MKIFNKLQTNVLQMKQKAKFAPCLTKQPNQTCFQNYFQSLFWDWF
jgi:hypothetical protein